MDKDEGVCYLRNRQTSGKQRDAEITNVNN